MLAPAASLFDQSTLTDRAERLVKAARARRRRCRRRGGGALACRCASKCATARSRNPSAPKATISACACWSARARRWSRPTTSRPTARKLWPSARSRWRGSRPTTSMPGSPIRALLARDISRSRSARSATCRRSRELEAARAARPKQAGLAVKGVTKSGGASASAGIGGMVLVTSHGFRGAYLGSQPRHLDDGDRRRRHRHGARLRLFHRRCMAPISTRPEKIGRTAGERAVARLNPRKVDDPQGAGGVRPARRRLAGRPSRQRRQRRLDRAQDQLPARTSWASSCSPTASASSTIRCACAACARSRSTPRASPARSSR